MNVYLTGDQGFIATRLATVLRRIPDMWVEGHDLIAKSARGSREWITDRIAEHGRQGAQADREPDVIVNLAATIFDQPGALERDCEITEAACRAAEQTNAHLIHISSIACAQADTEFVSMDTYAARKAAQEDVVAELYGKHATVIRLNNVYGFGRGSKGLFAALIGTTFRTTKSSFATELVISGDGSQIRSWMRIDKVVAALVLRITSSAPDMFDRRVEWQGQPASVLDFAEAVNSYYDLGIPGFRFNELADTGPAAPFQSKPGWTVHKIDTASLPLD